MNKIQKKIAELQNQYGDRFKVDLEMLALILGENMTKHKFRCPECSETEIIISECPPRRKRCEECARKRKNRLVNKRREMYGR